MILFKGKRSRVLLIFIGIFVYALFVIALLVWFTVLTPADRSILSQRPHVYKTSDGERTYRMYIPASLGTDTKLVFVLDGFGGGSRRVAYYSGMHNVLRDAIVVYPDPLGSKKGQIAGWNAGFCCGSGWVEKADDKGFLTSLASELSRKHHLVTDTFYVAGFSNGAFMTQRLAAEAPEKVRAAVSIAGTIGTLKDTLVPTAPVPILLIHGHHDRAVPFEGGARDSDPDFVWRSAAETEQAWRDTNGAQAALETYWHDGGHKWPGWRTFNVWHRRPEGSIKVMEFFEKH